MTEVYVLKETDYYDNTGISGVTTRKDVADYWETLSGCWVETATLDDLSDYRLERFRPKEAQPVDIKK